MYRRKVKTNLPLAKPSTSYSSLSSGGGITSTSSNITLNSSRRSPSPVDVFEDSPDAVIPSPKRTKVAASSPEPSQSKKSAGIPPSISPITKKNSTTEPKIKKTVVSSVVSPLKRRRDAQGILGLISSPSKSKGRSPSKKGKTTSRTLSYMEEVLVNAGMTLSTDSGENYNILETDQALFLKDIVKVLTHDKRGRDPKHCVKNFMDDMELLFSDKQLFKIALSPTKTDLDCQIARGEFQDSLIRILLSVDLIQFQLLEYLLEKIAEYTADETYEDENDSGIMWTRMILQQIRYLNRVSDSENITQKLFDVVHSTPSTTVKHEIINCLPDIIGDEQRKAITDELIELMRSDKGLTASILVALENLCLDESELGQLQLSVVKSLRTAPIEHLPAFVKFILFSSTVNDEVLNGLRSELVIYQSEQNSSQVPIKASDLASTQILIFEKLRDSVLMSKKLSDMWLKNISKVQSSSHHRPLDIIMLLILHSTATDQAKKKNVENVFKNKIKMGIFKEELIKNTFKSLMEIIKENFKDLLKIAAVLLQSSDIVVSQFGAFIYTECFIGLESHWRKSIVFELLDLARMSVGPRPALSLLHSLTLHHTSKISPFITLIMSLLDCVTEFSVIETRQLMDTLCLVAFGDPDDACIDTSSFQDEIYMLVQKQLACPDIKVFRSGVVCTVMAIKHMVSLGDQQSNITPENSVDSEALTPRGKKAYELLELVLLGTGSNAEAMTLTLDQLSFIVMNSTNLDKTFVSSVSSLMQEQLQKNFIISKGDFSAKNDGLDSKIQFSLDDDEEIEDPIALNLTEAMLKSESDTSQMPCVTLSSLLRVLCSLEKGDLAEIDALLGCPLALPDLSLFVKFNSVEPYVQRLALDALFHACNWFREIVNSFVTFVKQGKPSKVVKRLRLLIHLQGITANCLPLAVSYSPPVCYFSANNTKSLMEKKRIGVGKKGNKKKNTEREEGDETVANVDEGGADSDDDTTQEVDTIVSYSSFRGHLRELDFDTSVLLSLPLNLSAKPVKDGNDCTDEFGPKELMFVLDDFVSKLRHLMGPKKLGPNSSRSEAGFENLSSVPMIRIIKTFSKLSGHFSSHMQEIVEFSHNLIKAHDEIWDAPGMFYPGTAEIKQCMSLILCAFDIFLSWPTMKNECYSKYITVVLMKLGSVNKEDATSLNVVLQSCVTYLKEISYCIMELTSAVHLVSLIKTLVSYQDDGEASIEIDLGGVCENFLKRRWYDSKGVELKGSEVNRQMSSLVEVYLSSSEALEKISSTMEWLKTETENFDDDPSLATFPHFNKGNLYVLINCLCKGILGATKEGLEGKGYTEQLATWDVSFSCLQQLAVVIKAQDTKVNLRQFLKGCLPILKYFLSQGVNVCSTMFKMESVTVSQLLKRLQFVTRYIQTVCNYSKVSKDGAMIQQLPVMRGTLESIVLAVKNMVLQNKCTDAFFMGAMRNKGLKGEIIASQDDEEEVTTTEVVNENETNEGKEGGGGGGGSQSSADSGNQDDQHNQSEGSETY